MGRIILAGCLVSNNKKELLLLYRKDHGHYETPGGKVEPDECGDFKNPTVDELARTATRELFEELGEDVVFEDLIYFDKVEFVIPDGRKATAHKFLTKIFTGKPRINEPEIFTKLDWIPVKEIEKYPVSPDLKLLTQKIKNRFL